MTCYYPIDCWKSKTPNPDTGKIGVTFTKAGAQLDAPLQVPCGKCMGCRIERSLEWAMRCGHEASLYQENCFITPTYDDEHLPENGSLLKKDHTDFIKRLRRYAEPNKIRYFMCGEYGAPELLSPDNHGRPHFHYIIFNLTFDDLIIHSTKAGNKLYTSETLTKIWGKGHVSLGEVTPQSAGYVARYNMKKIGGDLAESHYQRTNRQTGEQTPIIPEFQCSSTKPAIGWDWFQKFHTDIDKGFIVENGKKLPIPKAYYRFQEKLDPYKYEMQKAERLYNIDQRDEEKTTPRLRVKEKIKRKRVTKLTRGL